jgi:hypothetical protein
MRIYIDLDTRRILLSPTRPATRLEFKRRDNDAFEVQFLRAGAVQELPAGTTARVGLKATNDFAGDFLATDTLEKNGTGSETIYTGDFNLNTVALEELFDDEPTSITAMLEVEWTAGTQVGSSLTLPVIIHNDVIRGDEGEPADLPIFYTSSTSDFLATQAEAEAGTNNEKWMSPLRVAQAIEELGGGGGGVSSWNDLTDKPATFPPETHTHPLSDLTQSSATTGQVVTWDGSAWVPEDPTGGGISSYLDLTDVPNTFPPSNHTHAISEITNLQTTLDAKAASSHTHAATDITSGTLALARVPTGTTLSTVALGNHSHGNITNAGAIGTTATLPIITGTSGVLQAGSFGTTAGTFAQGNHTHTFGTTAGTYCQGNDSRLLNLTGGITTVAVVAALPATPNASTLYIVTG